MNDEQTELLDELMTKLSHTQVELAMSMNAQKHNEALNIVKNHVVASISMGLIPMVLFDIAAMSTNQQIMLKHLCQHYDVDFDSKRVKFLVFSLLSGSLPALTIMSLASASKLIPGVGTLGGSAGVALLGGAVTYATGRTFVRHFSGGGTLEDFMPARFSGFFKKEFKKGKRLVNKLKPEAVAEAIT